MYTQQNILLHRFGAPNVRGELCHLTIYCTFVPNYYLRPNFLGKIHNELVIAAVQLYYCRAVILRRNLAPSFHYEVQSTAILLQLQEINRIQSAEICNTQLQKLWCLHFEMHKE